MVFADAEMPTIGLGFTVMVVFEVPIHPKVVPVTLYIVVEVGATVIGFAVPKPLPHK